MDSMRKMSTSYLLNITAAYTGFPNNAYRVTNVKWTNSGIQSSWDAIYNVSIVERYRNDINTLNGILKARSADSTFPTLPKNS